MTFKEILEQTGEAAVLEQTAEECTELAHACLKMARKLRSVKGSMRSWRIS